MKTENIQKSIAEYYKTGSCTGDIISCQELPNGSILAVWKEDRWDARGMEIKATSLRYGHFTEQGRRMESNYSAGQL